MADAYDMSVKKALSLLGQIDKIRKQEIAEYKKATKK